MGKTKDHYLELQQKAKEQAIPADAIQIRIGSATCENASGSMEVADEFRKNIEVFGNDNIVLHMVGCTGRCSCEPIVSIIKPGEKPIVYQKVNRETAHKIFVSHIKENRIIEESKLDEGEFYSLQNRIALRNAGTIDPENIFEYINHQGFLGLSTVLDKADPEWVIDQISKAKLRGRGGGGFPTSEKWIWQEQMMKKPDISSAMPMKVILAHLWIGAY